jgi:hypothetical protein
VQHSQSPMIADGGAVMGSDYNPPMSGRRHKCKGSSHFLADVGGFLGTLGKLNQSFADASASIADRNAELLMCEKCVEIDKNIERYRRIQRSIGDPATVDRTKEMIAELKDQKAALHPEQDEP